jgi:hypothetical protein
MVYKDGLECPRCSDAFWRWVRKFDVGTGSGSKTKGKREMMVGGICEKTN